MSTKHLEAVVEAGLEAARRHEVGPDAAVTLDRARRELEAIRKACRSIAGGYITVRAYVSDDVAHIALLKAIGEEGASNG